MNAPLFLAATANALAPRFKPSLILTTENRRQAELRPAPGPKQPPQPATATGV